MTTEQRLRVRQLFDEAFDGEALTLATPAEFDRWLDNRAGDDPVVRDEVRSLVGYHLRAGVFLQSPIVDRAPALFADEEPIPAGAKLGAYTIVRELGRGGMGRVYLASDGRLGRTVALKALAPHLVGDPSQRERLRREARLAASLSHPGICTVYALEEIDGDLYMASEFVDGRTLREDISAGRRPSPADLLGVARELTAALAYAHGRGIVHRDLKPENVMIAVDRHVKILDFGLARSETRDRAVGFVTQSGVLVGTPAYMAPEQIQGRPVDARADVYALGVLLYEYAMLRHPYLGGAPPSPLDSVIEPVVSRCLRTDPSDRFSSGGDVAAALDILAGGRTAGTHAPWWRIHQIAIAACYATAAALAWQIKEWQREPLTTALFIALGAASTIGTVLRGHLLFTERVNPAGLAAERQRAGRATRLVDVLVSGMLFADGMLITDRPLPSVLTLGLALGIVLAALVIESATTRAAFGDE